MLTICKTLFRRQTMFAVLLVLATATVSVAQVRSGAAAVDAATTAIKEYWTPMLNLILAVGGVTALWSGYGVYSKMSNDDPNFKGALSVFAGSMIFLVISPIAIKLIFGM